MKGLDIEKRVINSEEYPDLFREFSQYVQTTAHILHLLLSHLMNVLNHFNDMPSCVYGPEFSGCYFHHCQ